VSALLLVLAVIVAPLSSIAVAQNQPKTIVVGALLPLTGDLSDYGKRAMATLQVAEKDVNNFLEQQHAWFRIKLRIEDTATNPDQAVAKYNALVASGIKFIIGPMTSAEVKKLKDIATKQNVLLISPSSTALELAIPGDNVYRFCPADNVQAEAVAVLAVKYLHAKAAVLIIRADTWGEGLKKEIMKRLQAAGVEMAPPLEYNPESPAFGAIASQANTYVSNFIKKYGADKVVVYLVAFKEAAQLFTQAINYDALKKVVWIGSDGTAKLTSISGNPIAAKFSMETLFINPIYAPAVTKNQVVIAKKVEQMIGEPPDAYSYASYDALWAIALSLLDANPNMTPDELVDHVKAKLESGITESKLFAEHSATGAFPLNKAGDRATADYDFWIIYNFGGKVDWYKVGKYFGSNKSIVWYKVGGATYPQLLQEKFKGVTTTTTTTATTTTTTTSTTTIQSTTTSQSPTSPTSATATSPAPATTTKAKKGMSAGVIAAIVIIIIVVIVAAIWLARR
jgi:branched-chain amino acid transport system substrate-binding protein